MAVRSCEVGHDDCVVGRGGGEGVDLVGSGWRLVSPVQDLAPPMVPLVLCASVGMSPDMCG